MKTFKQHFNEIVTGISFAELKVKKEFLSKAQKFIDKQLGKQRWKVSRSGGFTATSDNWLLTIHDAGRLQGLEWKYSGPGEGPLSPAWTNGFVKNMKGVEEVVVTIAQWLKRNPGRWDESVELQEGTTILTVSFKTDEMIMKRIYERDLKSKFRKLYKSVNFVQRPTKGFEVVFKGKLQELEKVVRYTIGTLDKNNNIYHIHKMIKAKS